MKPRRFLVCCLITGLLASSQTFAWGPDGHHTVGAIADRLIAGTPAATEIKKLLGDVSLQDVSVWADCAKGIDPSKNYTYQTAGRYPECKIFETPELEAEMSDFVRRNDKNCDPKPGAESCHKQYHYADVAIQRDHYALSFVGARDDDLVHAIVAATHVLKGDPAPAPFNFKDKREALLVLSHYVGDVHQPLHIGAVYLDSEGNRVDPDAGAFEPKTDTHGGNSITVNGKNVKLHAYWDRIPASLTVSHVDRLLLGQAKGIPVTNGQVYDWPTTWASDTLGAAKQAFEGLKFGALRDGSWSATLPAQYDDKMRNVQESQLAKAGGHLAQVLQIIWP